ncbi:MAG TPA: PAS domain S-box protein [Burkholderiales bacterium]|nr:PAS domain S-box protein [Burkholderiales bacterium]
MQAPQLVRTNYTVRTAAFAYCCVALGVHLWEREATAAAWVLLALQFLVYPHLAYWRAMQSARPSRAELDNLLIDSALLGAWVAHLGFPAWIAYMLLGATLLNAVVNRGLPGAALSAAFAAAGAALYVGIAQWRYEPETSALVSALCFAGVLGYTCAVGAVVHRQNRRLARARDAVRASEERYRLIAENVADLVAMVDENGGWIYTSPSYARILDGADLEPGADSLRRAPPDDADKARLALLRVAATGRPRDIALRLVDREGRVRRYRMRVQPFAGDVPANGEPRRRLLLTSHDVTDLHESEEKLLLAGHALEGMTEAILITAADGTVLTVNKAFCDLTGHSRDEVLGQPVRQLRNALQPPEYYDQVYEIVQREGYWSGTQWARRVNGSVYREWRSVRAIRRPDGSISHYVSVFHEVKSPPARNGAHSRADQ